MARAGKATRADHKNLAVALAREGAAAIAILSLMLALTAAGLAVADIWSPSLLTSWREWGLALVVMAAGFLLFQLARLWSIWAGHRSSQSPPTRSANFSELFVYLTLSHSALAGVVFLSTTPAAFGTNAVNLSHTDRMPPDLLQVSIVVGLFAISFVPLLVAFLLQALATVRAREQKLLRDDVVSTGSLVIMTGLFGGIALLAWAAAGKMFEMTSDFGVLVTGVVIVAFIGTILAPHVARFWNDRSETREERSQYAMRAYVMPPIHPAKVVSRLDSILVQLVAPLSGATQRHLPHLILMAVMLPLCALGFILASPFGLIPIALGMLIILALGRRWAWLEDDRETASRLQSTEGKDIHIGFENDLKDEALLGYAWLFVLVPLALNQLQEWTHSFDVVAGATSGNAFLDWLRFFGAELAKAVPFVDWWEIYNVDVQTPFDAENAQPLAKHLTFISRALVDLVIMAALFQALGIWQRSRTQQRLYDTGQLDYFDPFTEVAFFETGMQSKGVSGPTPKDKFQQRVDDHVNARKALGKIALPYNTHRLAELLKSDNPDVRAGAVWMVDEYGVLTGSAGDQIKQLNHHWLKFELVRSTVQARNGDKAAQELVRQEKVEFERVLASVKFAISELSDEHVGAIYSLLETVKGSLDFMYGRDLAREVLASVSSYSSVHVLGMCVLDDRHHQARPDWRNYLQAQFGRAPVIHEARADGRERTYEALEAIGCNSAADHRARRRALELLELMSGADPQGGDGLGDRARSGRDRAKEAATKVAQCLGLDPSSPE